MKYSCHCYYCDPDSYRKESRQETRARESEEHQLLNLMETTMRIRITYNVSFDHGEYPDEESVIETEIDSWEDLPSELRTEDGGFLEVIKIEVI